MCQNKTRIQTEKKIQKGIVSRSELACGVVHLSAPVHEGTDGKVIIGADALG